jgi:hypothetical protein
MSIFQSLVMQLKHDNNVEQGSNSKHIVDGLMSETMFQKLKLVQVGMDDCIVLCCEWLV